MEALSVDEMPTGSGWLYEPKWDGFRCLVFRNRRQVVLQSKAGRPLTRYFPDVVDAALALKAGPAHAEDGKPREALRISRRDCVRLNVAKRPRSAFPPAQHGTPARPFRNTSQFSF